MTTSIKLFRISPSDIDNKNKHTSDNSHVTRNNVILILSEYQAVGDVVCHKSFMLNLKLIAG